MTNTVTKILVTCLGVASMTAFANSNAPHPDEVYIVNAVNSGNGCPAGTMAYNVSADAKAITLMFSDFVASAQGGPWGGSTRTQRHCRADINLRVPQGYSYALFNVDFRGYVQLSNRNASATQTANYSFGSRALEIGRVEYTGPLNQDYVTSRQIGLESLVWSPCGEHKTLTINTEVFATARSLAQALISVDSIDGQVSQTYGLKWRTCDNPHDQRPTDDRYLTGRCQVVLETIWGTDIRDFWGQVDSLDGDEAMRLAMDQANAQCEAARNGQFLYKCTKVPRTCTAQ